MADHGGFRFIAYVLTILWHIYNSLINMRSLHIVTDNILSITLLLNTHFVCVCHIIHISQDILLPIYMYLLYTLDGTTAAWMKSSVFIHLMELPSNPIIFGLAG